MNYIIYVYRCVVPRTELFQWLCAGVTEAMDSLVPSGEYIASVASAKGDTRNQRYGINTPFPFITDQYAMHFAVL